LEKSVPISFSREMPVTLIEPSLTSVILPSGLMVTSGSSEASIRLRAYCEACFCAVTSRAAANTPRTLPATSL
jgi:hypothetical protein